jgi:hypothetical protein
MLRRVFLTTQEIHVLKNILTDRIIQEMQTKDALNEDVLTLKRIRQTLQRNGEVHGHQRKDLDSLDSAFDWE